MIIRNTVTLFVYLGIALLNIQCSGGSGFGNNLLGTTSSKTSDLSGTLGSGNGNGQHYDGKIAAGVYIRPLTEKVCGPEIKNLGIITVSNGIVTGKVVDLSTCSYVDLQIQPDKFVHAEYLNAPLAYVEGLYTPVNKSQTAIPLDNSGKGSGVKENAIDEVWCRREGSSSTTGFDVIVKADYTAKKYSAMVASSTPSSIGVPVVEKGPAKPVDRRFEDMDRVRYKTDGFDLDIRRRDFNPEDGTMTADFHYLVNGTMKEMSLRCRLGGQLDVMVPTVRN